MSKTPLHREIPTEVRILDAKAGICEYVASDATLDHYREIIDPAGWKFTHFQRNAPFCDSHDTYSIEKLIGKVTDARVENGQLIERVQWAKDVPENTLAKLGWAMTEAGFLKAVSVGFFPVKLVRSGGDGWTEHCDRLKLDEDTRGRCRCLYIEQEQIELSACVIGANPSALLKAWEGGAVSDELMARAHLDSDDAQDFLRLASRAYDHPDCDEVLRWMMARQVKQLIGGGKPTSEKTQGGSHADPGRRSIHGPETEDKSENEKEADRRRKFLTDLQALAYLD